MESRILKSTLCGLVICYGKMSPALQRQFENYPPQNILAVTIEKCLRNLCCRALRSGKIPLHSCKQVMVKSPHDWVNEEELPSLSRIVQQIKKKSKQRFCRFRNFNAERKLAMGDQYLHMVNGAKQL
ncbi:hypothetical protein Tco_0135276 [Tanacetum coccineum]